MTYDDWVGMGKRVPIIPTIEFYVKFTDFVKFSILYYIWSREETTLIWKFNPSTIQNSYEKGRFAGHLYVKFGVVYNL